MGRRRFVECLDRRLLLAIDAAMPSQIDADSEVITQSAATAAASDGSSVVVYADRDGLTGKGNDVWLRRYAPSGSPIAAAERVNTTTADAQMNPDVAVASADSYAVVWQSENQDGSGWGIFARVHTSSGWSNEIAVTQTTAGAQVSPSIATTSAGFVVTWVGRDDNGGNGQIHARRFDAAGVAATSEIAVSADASFAVTAPDVAVGTSAIGVTWVSSDIANGGGTDVAFRQFDVALTNPAADARMVNTELSGDQAEPVITTLPGTNDFVVAFSDSNAPGGATIQMRRIRVGGSPFPQQHVSQDSDGSRSRPRISAANGTLVVGWTQNEEGAFYNTTATRVFDSAMSPTSNETFSGDGSTMRTLLGLAITGAGQFVEVATQGEFVGSGVGQYVAHANILDLSSTDRDDSVAIYDQGSNLRFYYDGWTETIYMSSYAGIRMDLRGGNDKLVASNLAGRAISVVGGAGNDTIFTGDGDDSISAGDGNDSVDAGDGNDFVTGGNDNDTIYASLGNDSVTGASGKDLIYGGDGNDRLSGNNGVDVMYGEAGDDRVYGDAGDDRLDGGAGRDRMYGGDGADFILGGSNNDHVYADAGNDTLTGSKGNDILEGGSGIDLVYNREPGDTLIDIELGL